MMYDETAATEAPQSEKDGGYQKYQERNYCYL